MRLPGTPARIVRFGAFEVDLDGAELRKNGVRLQIQEQPFQVLSALLERPGEVVAREELIRRLWPDGTVVDFDRGLNAAITRLRQTLSDSAEAPRHIETVPRRGYRFIAPLQTASPELVPPQPSTQAPPRLKSRQWLWPALAAMALIIGAVAWQIFRPDAAVGPLPTPMPITSYEGFERRPSLSPDGNQVAFEWDKGDGSRVYVKLTGAGDPVRLTGGADEEFDPVWSPDGKQIAFLRHIAPEPGGYRMGLYVIPALGGTERKLAELHIGDVHFLFARFLAWTSDGAHLLATVRKDEATGHGLLSIPAVGGEPRWLIAPPDAPNQGLGYPAVSPDGTTLAFQQRISQAFSDLYTVRLTDGPSISGEPRRLTNWNRAAAGIAWMPDGKSLLFASGYWLNLSLYRVDAGGGNRLEQLHFLGPGALSPASSRNGHVTFSRVSMDFNIWRQEIRGNGGRLPEPVKLISSTSADRDAQYSPDGSRIAFQSVRSGMMQIWTCASDGTQCLQVTHEFKGPQAGTPRWSPDGKWLVFDSNDPGNLDIYVVPVGGGISKRLTDHPADDSNASYSHDGKWIYFMSTRSDSEQIWRMPSGGGEPSQVTQNGGIQAFESADGKWLYYSQHRTITKLWKRSLESDGAQDIEVADSVYHRHWGLTPDRLFYLKAVAGTAELRSRPLNSDRDTVHGTLPSPNDMGLSASPDGRYVIYARIDTPGTDLMLVEGYR